MLKINFVGNYQKGYVGEIADEVHLTRNLVELGNQVAEVPRDIWKAWCDGKRNKDWNKYLPNEMADVNIICKWHHFNNGKYIKKLKELTNAPVLYWVWDYMWDDTSKDFVDFHKAMAETADVLLTNEGGLIPTYTAIGVNVYYFPFDVADGTIKTFQSSYKRDVAFFGSHIPQGDRVKWLNIINKKIPVTIFSWNHERWKEDGFEAHPAVYGEKFNYQVSRTKICLQFSVNDHCWGYWSNRVGKTLLAGGFLLARYAPGMELFLKQGVAYFHSPEEAIEKIEYYLKNEKKREWIKRQGAILGRNHFTSKQRCKELMIFIESLLK